MSKQILVVKGSPRKKGNTSVLADAFAKGAGENGHMVTEVILKEKRLGIVLDVECVRQMVETAYRKMI